MAEPIRLPFPVRGIDLGRTAAELIAARPVLFTTAARNIRNRPAGSARRGGGKRGGTAKSHPTRAGTATGRRITAVSIDPAAPETIRWRSAVLNLNGRIIGDATRAPSLGVDCALFAQDGSTGNVENNYDAQINYTDLSGSLNGIFQANRAPLEHGALIFDWYPAGAGNLKYPGLVFMGITNNDVTANFYAAGTASAGGNGEGTTGEPFGMGPFVRGSGDLSQCFTACLVRTGADTVRLDIIKINGASRAAVATGPSLTLNAQAWSDDTPYDPQTDYRAIDSQGLIIRMYATATTLTAELTWQRQGPGDGSTPKMTVTYETTDYASYTRAGVIAGFTASGATQALNRWYLRSAYSQVQVQPEPTVAMQLVRNQTADPAPLRYWLPSEFTGCRLTNAGTLTTFTGTSQASAPTTPAIDTLPVAIVNSAAASVSHFIVPTTTPSSLYAVEVLGRQAQLTGYDSDTTEDVLGAAFRVSSDKKTMVLIEVLHGFGTTAGSYQRTRQDGYTTIRFVAVLAGARTVLQTFTTASLSIPPFKSDVWQRWQDNGVVGSGGVFTLKINGQTIHTFDITTMTNWNGGTMAGLLTSTNLVGACFYGDTQLTYAYGFRLVDTSDEAADLLRIGEVRCDLAVVTNSGFVEVGIFGRDGLTRCSGGIASINPIPSLSRVGAKWYLFDGAVAKVIDPEARTVADLVASEGDLPTGMRLAAPYRGALMVASSREFPSFWALSRRGTDDPTDFDYGADPIPTAAIAGSDPDIGEVPDPIVALIPFGSEWMLFGTSRNFYFLERDPGYGGRMQTFTEATGIVGPRAWCKGATGNKGTLGEVMYFVGSGDLWRLAPAGRPVNVTLGRMPRLNVDPSQTLVQLAYDESDNLIHVYLTPTDGLSAGVHIVYDIANDATFEDDFPIDHGPWAVARGFGSDPDIRRAIMGGNDGYLRHVSDNEDTDDGTAIDSYVDILLPDLGGMLAETMVEEMQAGFLENSLASTWYWFTAETAEEVAMMGVGEHVATGTFSPTRAMSRATVPVSIRRTGSAHKVRIRQSAAEGLFSLEYLVAVMNMQGRRRIV